MNDLFIYSLHVLESALTIALQTRNDYQKRVDRFHLVQDRNSLEASKRQISDLQKAIKILKKEARKAIDNSGLL
jgi:hypothetical protein